MSVTNVICSIIMSVRFDRGDNRFKRFMFLVEEGFKLFGSIAFVNYIPVLRFMPWLMSITQKLRANRREMADFFQNTVDQHRETFDENNIRDLVDAYLQEIDTAKAEGREATLFQGKNQGKLKLVFADSTAISL